MILPLGQILKGDALEMACTLPSNSVHCFVTSPPYWQLRDYGVDGQLGLEETPEAFVEKLVAIFRELRRILRPDGTCWVNLGDTYAAGGRGGGGTFTDLRPAWGKKRARGINGFRSPPPGLKPKDLVGIPWRFALAAQADGWWLRSDIVWHKPNAQPGAVRDRPETSHEYVFLLTKSERYFYDADAIRQPLAPKTLTVFGTTRKTTQGDALGRVKSANISRDIPVRMANVDENGEAIGGNARTVWSIATVPTPSKYHYATFPPALARGCILAGTSERGACPACGAPWARVVERTRMLDGEPYDGGRAMRSTSKRAPSSAQGVGHRRFSTRHQTAGWAPSCACDVGDPVPCVVLDPFAGSGTTGVVAYELGREFVGIDIAGGDTDLGGHTANDRISAARRGQSLEEHLAGQRTIFDAIEEAS